MINTYIIYMYICIYIHIIASRRVSLIITCNMCVCIRPDRSGNCQSVWMHFVKLTVENGIFSGTSREEEVDLDHMHWMLAQDTWNSKQRQYILYCITVARSITVRRSSTDDHGCSASIMLAMVSSLPRVPSSFCLLFALRWLRNTRKSVARTKQCCLLSQERNLQSQSVFVFSQSEIYRNLLFVKKTVGILQLWALWTPRRTALRSLDLDASRCGESGEQWKTWRCDVKDC